MDEGDHGVRDELLRRPSLRAGQGRVGALVVAGQVRAQLGGVVRRPAPERGADARQVAQRGQRQVERPQKDGELERVQESARGRRRHGEEQHVHHHYRQHRPARGGAPLLHGRSLRFLCHDTALEVALLVGCHLKLMGVLYLGTAIVVCFVTERNTYCYT